MIAELLNSRNLWNENEELKKRIIQLEKKVDLLMNWCDQRKYFKQFMKNFNDNKIER